MATADGLKAIAARSKGQDRSSRIDLDEPETHEASD